MRKNYCLLWLALAIILCLVSCKSKDNKVATQSSVAEQQSATTKEPENTESPGETGLYLLTGTEKTKFVEGNIQEKYKEAYQKDKSGVRAFCEAANVTAKDLALVHEFSDENGNNFFDIKVSGNSKLDGSYIFETYTEDETGKKQIKIHKKVSKQEIELNNLSWYSTSSDLYYQVYSSTTAEERKRLSPVSIPVDNSTVKDYEENYLSTDEIWGAYSGYVDKSDKYMVSYVEDTNGGWCQGVFNEKTQNWKVWDLPTNPEYDGDYHYTGGKDDTLWYYNDKVLIVSNKKGKQLGKLDIKTWKKKNGISDYLDIVYLENAKAILSAGNKSYLVDIKSGKTERTFDIAIDNGVQDGNLLYVLTGMQNEVFFVVDLSKGKIKESLDLASILNEYPVGKRYTTYHISEKQVDSVLAEDYPISNISALYGIDLDVHDGTVYFSYTTGVYRWNKKENKLEKIFDGTKSDSYLGMCGSFSVGKDESIYRMGFVGGGDDEGANDFLYYKRK